MQPSARRTILFSGLVLFLVFTGCSPRDPVFPKAPVIIISVDTLRSDHLPAYGYSGVRTPAIDALAADSILFERAYSHYPLTLPSHATLFTGKITPNIGVRNNAGFHLEDGFVTLAERLRDEGYDTAGIISSMVLKQATGIGQGFTYFNDDLSTVGENHIRMFAQRTGDQSAASAKSWLQNKGNGSFFLFLHLYDPHAPYEAPEPFASSVAHPYDAEIAFTDHVLGDFIAFLKEKDIYDRALIVFLSDHGEGLGDHGEEEHGVLIYRESIQVPLMVKLPGSQRAGARVAAPVALIDVKPSVLNALGLSDPDSEGVPIFNRQPPKGRLIFSETLYPLYQFGWCPSKGIVKDNLQYLEICEPELYDLSADPGERQNLFGSRKTPEDIRDYLQGMGEGLKSQKENTREELELLASLGYTGGVIGVDEANARDPKAGMAVFKELDTAKIMLEEKRYAEAETFLVPLIQENPGLNDGRYLLVQALVEQEKYPKAEFVCLEGLGFAPTNLNYLIALTTIKLRLGKSEEAFTSAARAFDVDPDVAGAQLLLPIFEAGNREMALAQSRKLLEKFTDTALSAPYAHMILGRDARAKGNHAEAVVHLEQCISLQKNIRSDTSLALAYHALGDSYGRLGQELKAVGFIQKALELKPDFADGYVTLSYLFASLKNPRNAVGALDQWLLSYPTKANFERAAQVVLKMGLKSKAGIYQAEAKKYEE